MDSSRPSLRGAGGRAGVVWPALASLATGLAVLCVEALAPRLVARHLGTAVVAWTSSIAAVLGGLAIGSAVGGRAADRYPPLRVVGAALLASAAAVAAMPILDAALEHALAALPLGARAPLHLAAVALPPCAALGAASPGLARVALAAVPPGAAGRALGLLSAAGSAGGVAGLYLAGYVLVPALPTSRALRLLAAGLAALGACCLARRSRARSAAPARTEVPAPATAPAPPLRGPCALAFLAGAAALAVEVLAARVTARTAGSGLHTWTGVLAVSLAALAVGGAVGGRVARRTPAARAAGPLLVVAAGLLVVAAWTSPGASALEPSALPLAARVALRTTFAWAGPLAALGALSVVAARWAAETTGRQGGRLGAVYAAGAVGAAAGALGTAPLALPLLGAAGATLALAAALAGAALLRRAPAARPLAAVAAALALAAVLPVEPVRDAGLRLGLREDAAGVLVRETPYARVKVEPAPASRAHGRAALFLLLDDAVHGLVDPADPAWIGIGYVGTYAAVTDRVAPPGGAVRALCLGGGGYAVPRLLLAGRPGSHVDVVEIDPGVTRAAQARLGLRPAPGLRVHHEDARTFLRDRPADAPPFDVVYGDAFDDVAVPFHLTTVEAARAVSGVLAPSGVYLLNVIDLRDDPAFLRAVAATLRAVFPHVEIVEDAAPSPRRAKNRVLVASRRPLELDGLSRADPSGATPGVALARVARDPRPADVLRDDHAPVERLLAPVAQARISP